MDFLPVGGPEIRIIFSRQNPSFSGVRIQNPEASQVQETRNNEPETSHIKEQVMSTLKQNDVALVTGASSGLGAVYADRLAKRGFDLIVVARDASRLEALSRRISAEAGRSVTPFPADLTDQGDLARVERLLRENDSISMLVNNAGIGAVTPLLETDIHKVENLISLNVSALTRLTYAAAPAFVRRGRGTIINIASTVSVSPETLNGVYGATKAYVVALTRSLEHELSDKGIRIQAVLPGATATDFWDKTGLSYENLPESIVMSTEDVVDAALAGLDQGENVTIPGLHDNDVWARFDAARSAVWEQSGTDSPAPRYHVPQLA